MDLQDICDGCGRHPGVCMCSVSISAEGAIATRPNPVNLAGKLKMIASDASTKRSAKVAGTIADVLRQEARFAAQAGRFGLLIWLKDKGWSKSDAENAATELRRDGIEVLVSREITAWYSNTDWDEDEFISLKWS
jgi:hypothetical protein